MKSLLKKIVTTFAAVALLSAPLSVVAPAAYAQDISTKACEGVNLGSGDCDASGSQNSFNELMKRVINIFSIVVGAVSVVMIIIGGFRYIISGGDSAGVSGAKNTILYAVVGLVIVLFAQILVRFVVANLSQASTPTNTNTTTNIQTQQTQ